MNSLLVEQDASHGLSKISNMSLPEPRWGLSPFPHTKGTLLYMPGPWPPFNSLSDSHYRTGMCIAVHAPPQAIVSRLHYKSVEVDLRFPATLSSCLITPASETAAFWPISRAGMSLQPGTVYCCVVNLHKEYGDENTQQDVKMDVTRIDQHKPGQMQGLC